MAKKVCRLTGNFIEVFAAIDDAVRESVTAPWKTAVISCSEASVVPCVYMNGYSMTGSNRVSMNITPSVRTEISAERHYIRR
jgi:hypothetical protein